MAEYNERSMEDLTEEPTPYRLEELRKKGQTVLSREVSTTVSLLLFSFLLGWYLQYVYTCFHQLILLSFKLNSDLKLLAKESILAFSKSLGPLFIGIPLFTVLGFLVQSQGFVINSEVFEFKLERLNPLTGFQKIFSLTSVGESIKNVLKLAVIGLSIYLIFSGDEKILLALPQGDFDSVLKVSFIFLKKVFISVALISIPFAGVDYFIQWLRFQKTARSTKAEAKQEAREREGDPQLKARMRLIQRELIRKRMMQRVAKATVIVANPTHFAVALEYSADLPAPRLLAKGADFLALRIKEVAKQHNIPIVENRIIARQLYYGLKVGQYVPKSLYRAVAEILAIVYKIRPEAFRSQENNVN